MALVDIETYYSFPNVSSNNNHVRFSTDVGNNWRVKVIPTGAYSIKALNTEINDQLPTAGDIQIRGIEATLRCEMKLAAGVTVDFTHPDSINTILGFDHWPIWRTNFRQIHIATRHRHFERKFYIRYSRPHN